jgi:hypothetical protein
MDGGEWGFVQQTNFSNISPPPFLLLCNSDISSRINNAQSQRDSLKSSAVTAHVNYWSQTSPGQYFEHWRFGEGYDVGFSDATTFFEMRMNGGLSNRGCGADKIGCLEIWIKKRMLESGQQGDYVWEWEQGLRKGVTDFYDAAGV